MKRVTVTVDHDDYVVLERNPLTWNRSGSLPHPTTQRQCDRGGWVEERSGSN